MLRIVLVEGDAIIAELFSELLSYMGHEVCALAATEVDALGAVRTHTPDLLIVDEVLGLGSGARAVNTLLEERYVPHVVVTTQSAKVRELLPKAVVVAKPFREADLVDAMRSAVKAVRISQ